MAKIKKPKAQSPVLKPIIGVIGGCGVLATLDIEKEIIQAAQRLMSPLVDQDYPNMLIYQYTQFHDRNDAICFNGCSPHKQYLECANALISIGARVLLFACNTAHIHIEFLKRKIQIPIVDIIQETVKSIVREFPNVKKIGLLSTDATVKEKLYHEALAPHKVSVVTPNASIRRQVMQAIYLLKAGVINEAGLNEIQDNCNRLSHVKNHPHKKIVIQKNTPNPCELISKAIQFLINKGCTHVILGCTELPLVLESIKMYNNKIMLINPNRIAAEAIIEFYIGKPNDKKYRSVGQDV